MGQLAAKIDVESRQAGVLIPFADLQIGVTAVHLSCAIATRNIRHFRMIPNLVVETILNRLELVATSYP